MFDRSGKLACTSLIVFISLTFSLLFPTAAYADDATPPEQTTETTVTPEPETQAETTATEPPTEEVVPEPESVADAVQALIEADAVLVDAEGEPIPLGSEAAVEALSVADPYIVRSGITHRFLTDCTGQPVDAFNTCTVSATPIQSALDFSVAGETVVVEAGVFNEQIVINKSVSLVGAGAGVSFIQAPGVLVNNPDGNKAIVLIDGATTVAELTGFTIAGPGPSGCGSLHYGVYVRGGATVNIHDNTITDVRDEPFSGCQNGVAIQVGRQVAGHTGTAIIDNNEISGYQKNGITVDNTGSSATITDNVITGAGPTSTIAQNGIQVSRGATATIQGNTVTGNIYTPATVSSTGILLYQAGNTDILDNILDGNDINVYITLSGNTLVDGNTLVNGYWNGVWVDTSGLTTMTGNVFTGNLEGIGVDSSMTPANVVITGNTFSGNTTAVYNYGPATIDASGNYWGDGTGPYDNTGGPDGCGLGAENPLGAGDPVSGCVLYDPWLVTDPTIPPDPDPTDPAGPSDPALLIPVTGGSRIVIDCTSSSMTLQVGTIEIIFTGLCGYEAIVDPLVFESLPGSLANADTFIAGATLTLLKDGTPVDSLPAGASLQVSRSMAGDGTPKVLVWEANSWVEVDSQESDGRIESQLEGPGTFVFVD